MLGAIQRALPSPPGRRWLEAALGIQIPELGHDRAESLSYGEMTVAAAAQANLSEDRQAFFNFEIHAF